MLRIRRIYDDIIPANQEILRQVKYILKSRFSSIAEDEVESIGEKLRNPFKQRFRMVLFVAEGLPGKVLGFATLLHEPVIGFAFLDWLAIEEESSGSGLGAALYERVRQEAAALKAKGLFFECLPDEAALCQDQNLLAENQARLRFYEQYGARPIVGTSYEMPVNEGDSCMPHLVYDALAEKRVLSRSFARKVVRAILERKYAALCSARYVEQVEASFINDPVQLREFRYLRQEEVREAVAQRSFEHIALIVNDKHDIHHVHERGYVESPVRIKSILAELDPSELFVKLEPRTFPQRHLLEVHSPDFVSYLERACLDMEPGKSQYPYIFPIRNKTRPPSEPSVLAGYYCIDTFTPINRNAYPAARRAVDCALSAAQEVLDGRRLAYALVRPPGHHAEYRSFGGFCYFNNNAIAAHYLSHYGKVAILDLDYHHGNGQQDIFYHRSDVLTVSLHGHPDFAYPYFSGFSEEIGEGEGYGFNLNIPLPERLHGREYREALKRALTKIETFHPSFLVVALGLDPAKGDPTGTWSLTARDFRANGEMVGSLGLPTIVIQEGGYRTATLGKNGLAWFKGLAEALRKWADSRGTHPSPVQGLTLREELQPEDPARIRTAVEKTNFFNMEEADIATELAQDRLDKGTHSDYNFVIAEHDGRMAGYSCYGRIPCTRSSYDLYWIVVHPDYQGRQIGRALLKRTEELVLAAGGERLYADTSQRPQYAATRSFYEQCDFQLVGQFPDFYAQDDGKAVYCRTLTKITQTSGFAE